MSRLLALLALLAFLALPARAEDAYAWTMPPPEEQLAADTTPVPLHMGAIFVPSITGPEFEPPASLVSDEEIISVPVGQRFAVPPGPYVVLISSGSPTQGVSISIDVVEGETVLIPVQWGALQVEVTDDHRTPHRGSYELIRADTRQPVGTGFGVDTLQGEILQTWLLPPGIYRIVRPGRNFRALRDFATVVVPESGFVRYRLVQDPDTEEFLGAGVLLPDEFSSGATRQSSRWFRSVVLGVDGSSVSNQNVVGVFNQTQYTAAGFLDAQFGLNTNPHRVAIRLQVDEGVSQVRPQEAAPLPLVKSTDRLQADLLYTLAVERSTGPYIRGSASSQAFATRTLVAEDTNFTTTLTDGTTQTTAVAANETFRLSDAWEPTLIREGIGVNTSFVQKNRSVNFNWRIGFGMRQNIYGGALVLEDNSSTDDIEYTEVDSFYEAGVESTLVATVRLPGWIVYSTDVELFAPFLSINDPAIGWRNTLSLRVTRNLSLNYFAEVNLEPKVLEDLQIEQSLLLRASWVLL